MKLLKVFTKQMHVETFNVPRQSVTGLYLVLTRELGYA
jgi:hypothetical protein